MCPTSQELSAYHDEALDREHSTQVERHLESCPACASELAELRKVSQWLAHSKRPAPSADAVRRLVDFSDSLAARAEPPSYGRLRLIGRVVSGLAAAVLLFGVLRIGQLPSPQTRTASTAREDWESVALREELPENAMASADRSDTQFAEWVVSGLSQPAAPTRP